MALNFRRENPRKRTQSMDGMWGGKSLPKPQASGGGASLKADPNSPRRLLDDFKRQDGYHPQSQAQSAMLSKPNGMLQGENSIGITSSSTSQAQSSILPSTTSAVPDPKAGHGMFNRTMPLHPAYMPKQAAREDKKAKRRRLHFRRPKLRTVIKGMGVAVSVLVLVYGGLAYKGWRKVHDVFHGGAESALSLNRNVDPSRLKGEGDGRINILLTGNSADDPNHPGGELTDSIMVLSIDPISKAAAVLSIPRDFWLNVKPYGYTKINAAYVYGEENKFKEPGYPEGGIGLLQKSLEEVLGINIHYYVLIDFSAFTQAIDAVGGIDITLEEAIWDPNFDNEYGRNALKLPAGTVHLNGTTALLLGRSRNANGGYGVGNDFERTKNQRKMLVALKEKALSLDTFADPRKLYRLIEAVGDHVHTNISFDDLTAMYELAKSIPANQVASLGLSDEPNRLISSSMSDSGQSILIPTAGIGIYKDIQNFVHNELRDGFLKSENARIVVLNGTDKIGIATNRAEDLRSYGYSVTKVGDSTVKVPKTVIVDNTNGVMKYTKRYLELRLQTTATTTLPTGMTPEDADFVIILGDNETISQ